jgi:hypothetical protein
VQNLNWRWVFYLNFPFCVAGLVMIPLFVKINTTLQQSIRQKVQRVDWLGSFLFIAGTTSFLIGVSWGGIQYKWTSAQTLAPILAGMFGICISCVWETKVKEPILRGSLFYNVSAVAAYYCAFAQGFLVSIKSMLELACTNTTTAIHRTLLCSLLFHVRTRYNRYPKRRQHLSSSLPPPAWIYRYLNHQHTHRPLPMGPLERLVYHDSWLRPLRALRPTYQDCGLGWRLQCVWSGQWNVAE